MVVEMRGVRAPSEGGVTAPAGNDYYVARTGSGHGEFEGAVSVGFLDDVGVAGSAGAG
jgi:hypothetical protein